MSDISVETSSVQSKTLDEKAFDKEEMQARLDEEKAIGGKKQKNILKAAGKKLAQPVVDKFHKDYGEDAVATPKTVADFIFDHGAKIAIAAATIGITFAATRGSFNGFTKHFSENVKKDGVVKAASEALEKVKVNNAKAVLEAETAKNSARSANELAEALEGIADGVTKNKNGKKGIISSVARIFTGTEKSEFAEGSKIPEMIDKLAGKNADKVKSAVLKAGVSEGSDVVDLALATTATTVATGETSKLASDAVDKNDKKLGLESKIDTIAKGLNLIEKFVG